VGEGSRIVSGMATVAELRLLVRCHEHVIAVGAAWVERILLSDEVAPPTPAAALGASAHVPRACLGVLTASGATWAAWDLAELLERPPVGAAYLLLQRPYEGGLLRLALRTDRCLHVGPLPAARGLAIAPGAARARRGLMRAAFAVAPLKLRQHRGGDVGLDLDLRYLWSDEELELARDLLSRAELAAARGGDGAA
jgi:hypothetical protein